MEKRNTLLQGVSKVLEPIYNPVAGTVEQARQAANPNGFVPKTISADEWNQYVQNPLGKNIQNLASIASLFVPVGGASTLLGTIARGAGAGALAGFGSADLTKQGSGENGIIQGALLGGGTAGLLGAAGKIYSKLAGKGAKAAAEVAPSLAQAEAPAAVPAAESMALIRPSVGIATPSTEPLPVRISAGTPPQNANEFIAGLLKDFPSPSQAVDLNTPQIGNAELKYLNGAMSEVAPGTGALPIPKAEVPPVLPAEVAPLRNPTQAEVIKGKLFAGSAAKTGSPQALESAQASVVKQFEDAKLPYNTDTQRARGIIKLLDEQAPKARAAVEGVKVQTQPIISQLQAMYRDAPALLQKYGKEIISKLERAGSEIDGAALHDIRTFADSNIPESAFGPATTALADKTRVMSDIRDVLSGTLKSNAPAEYAQLLDNENALLTLRKPANLAVDKGNKITLIPGTNAKVNVAPVTNRLNAAVTKGRAAVSGGVKLPTLDLPTLPNSPVVNAGVGALPALIGRRAGLPADVPAAQSSTGVSSIPTAAILASSGQTDVNAILDSMIRSGVKSSEAIAYIKANGLDAGSSSGGGSDAAKRTKANATSGIKAITDLSNIISKDASTIFTSKLPSFLESPAGRQFNVAANEIADVITRLRTGAALNEEEQKFYLAKIPQPFDDPETIKYKLSQLQDLFTSLAQ